MDGVAPRPKPVLSAAIMERRRKALCVATADSRLEGQFSSPASNEVFEAFVRGDIDLKDILPRIKALHNQL